MSMESDVNNKRWHHLMYISLHKSGSHGSQLRFGPVHTINFARCRSTWNTTSDSPVGVQESGSRKGWHRALRCPRIEPARSWLARMHSYECPAVQGMPGRDARPLRATLRQRREKRVLPQNLGRGSRAPSVFLHILVRNLAQW